jgi:hypothetical protein
VTPEWIDRLAEHGFRHVLVLLDDDEDAMSDLMRRAIELVEADRARLTIAKTTDPGRIVTWFAPLTMLSRGGPMLIPDTDFGRALLDRATAWVPASVPLTRVLLGLDTACALRELVRHGCYDLLIVREGFLARHRALRRVVRRRGGWPRSNAAGRAGWDAGAIGPMDDARAQPARPTSSVLSN